MVYREKKADGWYGRWEQSGKNLEEVEGHVDSPSLGRHIVFPPAIETLR